MKDEPLKEALGDLAGELAKAHGAMFQLIVNLYKTQLSPTQAALLQAADVELAESQKRFLTTYRSARGGGTGEN